MKGIRSELTSRILIYRGIIHEIAMVVETPIENDNKDNHGVRQLADETFKKSNY